MRAWRITQTFALPAALLLGGCGYVHVGKLPAPVTTVMGDDKLMKENSDLRLEKKLLQQELALTRSQGEALRSAIENRAADGDTSRRLTERLNETTRELATLRAGYANLQLERNQAVATAAEANALQARLGATEEKLAASLRTYTELQEEVGRLRGEVDRARTENLALSAQVKAVTSQNEQAQAALAQLNTQLLAQKDARARAEQDVETLRTQIQSGPNASALAQQRTGAAAEARTLVAEQVEEIAALKQDLSAFRTKLGALETERDQLKQQLAGSPSPDLANVEARLSTTLRENEQLKAASAQLSATRADLETQLARLKNAPGAGQAAVLREQLREAQEAALALTEENARLKSRLGSNRTETTGVSREPARINTVEPPTRIELVGTEPRAPTTSGEAPAATTSGGTITRGSGVNATLVMNVPGSTRSATQKSDAGSQGRVHVVTGGDTLSKISTHYYGTPTRWNDILAANRDILGESNNLVIGRTLRIP